MSEEAYDAEAFRCGRGGKTLAMKKRMIEAAKSNGGKINVGRIDRETGRLIVDEITSDMPLDELVL